MTASAVLVTRGDVPLDPITDQIEDAGIHDIVIVDNSKRPEDLAVFGRYIGVLEAKHDTVFVQDDDCLLPAASIRMILDSYRFGTLAANLPAEYRARYRGAPLVGFGAVFHRDLPRLAFAKFFAQAELDLDVFNRTCDIVFATLTRSQLLDVPFQHREFARDPGRMWTTPGNRDERSHVLALARKLKRGRFVRA